MANENAVILPERLEPLDLEKILTEGEQTERVEATRRVNIHPALVAVLQAILHYGQAGVGHDLVRITGTPYPQPCACEILTETCAYCDARAALRAAGQEA